MEHTKRLALTLALTTGLAVIGMLLGLRALRRVVVGLGSAVVTVALLSGVSFVVPGLLLGPVGSAALGLVLYGALLILIRPRGLVAAWRYLHAL